MASPQLSLPSPGFTPAVLPRLSSLISELDAFLGGGLPLGAVTEIGMPLGHEGRQLLLPFLLNATQGLQPGLSQGQGLGQDPWLVLWVNGHSDLAPFPPSWYACGIDPERLVFTDAPRPLATLSKVFIRPLFRLIVLDAPQEFTAADGAFVKRQARRHGKAVVILRDGLLSQRQGNVVPRIRFNALRQMPSHGGPGSYLLTPIKGLKPQLLTLTAGELPHLEPREAPLP